MKSFLKVVAKVAFLAPAVVINIGMAMPAITYAATANCPPDKAINIAAGPNAGAGCAAPASGAQNLFGPNGVFVTITNIMLFMIGAIAVVMLIIGGIRYVVSSGDQNAVTGAKNTILYAIIGIIVAFLAYAAVNFVTTQISKGNV